MSNSANNNSRTASIARGTTFLIGSMLGMYVSLGAIVVADDNDIDRTKLIIAKIQQKVAPERDRVDRMLAQIPLQSPYRPIASQAACIVHIQQGQFADALKCLQSAPVDVSSSTSLQLGEQRLRLWLLIEMESNEETDAMLKTIVNLASSNTLEDSEQESLIEWLGAVSGMLQTVDQPIVIAMETKNQITAAVETLSNDSTALRFKVLFDKSSQRGDAIKARMAEFREVGLAEAAAMLSALKTELAAHEKLLKSTHRHLSGKRQTVEQLETYFESLKTRLEDLEGQIRTLPSQHSQLLVEHRYLAQEIKMLIPPRLPPTTYKRDPVTGQEVVDRRPSQCEMQMYMVEKARYQEQRDQLSDRMSQVMRKMNNGSELRNETLAIRKQQRELGKEIEGAKRIRSLVEDDVAEAEKKRNILAERLLISRFALADVSNTTNKSQSCIRPSRFDLMDYAYEESRLMKVLRQQENNP